MSSPSEGLRILDDDAVILSHREAAALFEEGCGLVHPHP